MTDQHNFTLNNGVDIPAMGFGTWMIGNNDAAQAVADALTAGFRHVDTAQVYRNEATVAEGVRRSGLARDEVFITSKVDAGAKSYAKAAKSLDASLSKMGLDYLDLMIIHSPQPWTKFHTDEHFFEQNLEVWRALEEAHQAGKIRAIGLSNFEQVDVDNIVNNCTVRPAVNQVLAHIGNMPFELIEHSQQQGMLVEAYSPVAHGQLLHNATVAQVAEHYGVSTPQLSLRYLLQHDLLPLPKTVNPAHMRANLELDFEISAEDMAALDSIEPITDYGDDGAMPVFGGRLTLGSMARIVYQSLRSSKK